MEVRQLLDIGLEEIPSIPISSDVAYRIYFNGKELDDCRLAEDYLEEMAQLKLVSKDQSLVRFIGGDQC